MLTQYLSAADREKYRGVEADSRFQEQVILKDEPYAEQDVARGDPKSLIVDQAILQDAFNQDEADLAKLQALEAKISKQAKKAAKATVAGGGIVGFDWIILGLGVFTDMASYFGSYAERRRLPYGDRFPTY